MDFLRRYNLLIVGGFILILISFFGGNFNNFTGNSIFDYPLASDCDLKKVSSLWALGFNQDSSKEPSVKKVIRYSNKCSNFVAYNVKGTEVYYMIHLYQNNSDSQRIVKLEGLNYDVKSIFDYGLIFGYFNGTSELVKKFEAITDLNESISFFRRNLKASETSPWNDTSNLAIKQSFDSVFKEGKSNLLKDSSGLLKYDESERKFLPDKKIDERKMELSVSKSNTLMSSEFLLQKYTSEYNHTPLFKKDFENLIYLRIGEKLTISLRNHFEDLDGDTLTYSFRGSKSVNVTFDENLMYLRVDKPIQTYENLWISASDGLSKIESDKITIFSLNATTEFKIKDPPKTTKNDTLNNSNNLNNSNKSIKDYENLDVVIWVLVLIMVAAVLFLIIYYIIFNKKKPKLVEKPQEPTVSNYLKELNLEQEKARYSSADSFES